MKKILNLKVSSDRIVFAHPCKLLSHLKYAKYFLWATEVKFFDSYGKRTLQYTHKIVFVWLLTRPYAASFSQCLVPACVEYHKHDKPE